MALCALVQTDPTAAPTRSLARLLTAAFAIIALAVTGAILPATTASAAAPFVVINGGGGTAAGTGLKLEFNRSSSMQYEQIWFENAYQYYSSGSGNAGPHLNVGGQTFGQAFAATTRWTSVSVLDTSGSASTDASTTTGSGSATIRYTATVGGLDYLVDRRITYTYPNTFFTDEYTFVIPSGNTAPVKFYAGGDTTPGGSDHGYGIMLTAPVRSVVSLNPVSGVQIGYREIAGNRPFDGATSQYYYDPVAPVQSGGDIGFVATATDHDAGLMMQWNLGSTPGTFTGAFQTFVGQQAATLNASFSAPGTTAGTPVTLALSIDNSLLTAETGIGYRFALPAGLEVAAGSIGNACSGVVTAVPGSSEIQLTGGEVAAASNCVVTVPVVTASNGTYTITSAAVTELTKLSNGVGTITLVVGTAPAEPGALPSLSVGTEVDVLLAFGGDPAPSHLVTSGALPAGLSLASGTGRISGSPTAAGAYDFTVTATNAIGSFAQRFTGTVTAAPAWPAQVLPQLAVGTAVNEAFTATGTPAPSYTLSTGELPAGLSIVGGAIEGTPTAGGDYDFTVTASNSDGSASMRFTGGVLEAPSWPTQSWPRAIVGEELTVQLTASGHPAPTYTVTAGTLPAGLSLDEVTGLIGGLATSPGAYDVTITASNLLGDVTQRFRGTVGTIPALVSLDLSLAIGTSPNAVGNHVDIAGEGLLPGAEYSVVMRSTPVTLLNGIVLANGRIAHQLQLPASIEPGVHTLTLASTAADGTPVSTSAQFRIAADGTITALEQQAGSALASTGADLTPLALGAMLVLLGAGVLAMRTAILRRQR